MNEKTYTVKHRGKTAATISFTYPDSNVPAFLERFLRSFSERKAEYSQKMISKAISRQMSALGDDFQLLSSQSAVQIMAETDRLISLFCDTYFDLGVEGTYMERNAFTFDRSGRRIRFGQLFVKPYRQKVFTLITEQIISFCEKTGCANIKNPQKAISEALSRGDFYLSDDGIAVFFRQGSIASKIWGIPTFLAEYKKLEGLLDKKLL